MPELDMTMGERKIGGGHKPQTDFKPIPKNFKPQGKFIIGRPRNYNRIPLFENYRWIFPANWKQSGPSWSSVGLRLFFNFVFLGFINFIYINVNMLILFLTS